MSPSDPPLQTSPPLPARTHPPPALTFPSPATTVSPANQQRSSTTTTQIPLPHQQQQQKQPPSIRIHSDPVHVHLPSQHGKHASASGASTTAGTSSSSFASDTHLRASAEKYYIHGHLGASDYKLKRSRSPIKLIRNIRTYFHGQRQRVSGNLKLSGSGSTPTSPAFSSPLRSPVTNSGVGVHSSLNTDNTKASSSSTLSPLDHPSAANGSNNPLLLGPNGAAPPPPPPRPKNTAVLDPEKQVLLLRVMSYFEHAGHPADEETAEYLLASYQWDIGATLQYCQDLVEAVQGTLVPVDQHRALQGAVNDQMTSCYIDSLLFAMFARLSAFEGLLNVNLDGDDDNHAGPNGGEEVAAGTGTGTGTGTGGTASVVGSSLASGSGSGVLATDSADEEQRQEALLSQHLLQTWLRMFVNQLRQGRLVQAHVVRELRQHLYSCGWSIGPQLQQMDSRLTQQQLQAIASRQEDASELFMFLTEILHLPYLPLEQRLLHGARISDDDDKVITERMLQICVPTPEEQRQQQAKEQQQHQQHQQQHHQDPASGLTVSTSLAPVHKTRESRLARFLYPRSNKADKADKHQHHPHHHQHLSTTAPAVSALPPLPARPSFPSPSSSPELEILSLEKLLAQHFYDNTLTGIRRKVSSGTGAPLSPGVEIPVSAWQVLELLPFYSSSNEQGQEVAASRRQYPGDVVILPLILKRYSFGMDGQARRIGTPIEIPRRIDFSRFVNPGPERSDSVSSATSFATSNEKKTRKWSMAKTQSEEDSNNGTDTQSLAPAYTAANSELYEEPASEPATPTDPTQLAPPPAALRTPPLKINTTPSTPTTAMSSLRKFSLDKAGNFLARTLLDSPTVPDTPPPKYTPSSTLLPTAAATAANDSSHGDRKVWPPALGEEGLPHDNMTSTASTAAETTPASSRTGENGRAKARYFLELKSVVCHLGSRLDSGHYRSYVANGPPPPDAYRVYQQHDGLGHGREDLSSEDCGRGQGGHGRGGSCGTSDGGVAQGQDCEPEWLRHDDLDPTGQRVRAIAHDSDMNMEMESDWACNGYILFYELRTIHL
ncbi:hypothetical protein BGZ73_006161 [Actinomortierella ambigua]|nr:hypothetical protein BGZ73_006161 [Actinomortierella ambigua]